MNAQMSAQEREEFVRVERKARRFWVTLIVGMLGLQVAIGVTSVVLSLNDSTVAVIPNYYQSAVNWDTTRRARQLTDQLGWKIEMAAGPTTTASAVGGAGNSQPAVDSPDGRGANSTRQLLIEILDRNGEPIEGVNVSGKVYHHARGAEIFGMRLKDLGEGRYAGTTELTKSGLWQVELRLEGDHGIASVSREMLVP